MSSVTIIHICMIRPITLNITADEVGEDTNIFSIVVDRPEGTRNGDDEKPHRR